MQDYIYYIFLIGMIVLLYFVMIRPDSKKRKQMAQMRKEIAVGDDIETIGGMVGKVCSIDGDKITFETGEDRVRIQIKNWGISTKAGFEQNTKKSK